MNRQSSLVMILTAVLGVAIFAAWQPSRVLCGTIAGDPFFAGYPSRYWGSQLFDNPSGRSTAISTLKEGGANSVSVLRDLLRNHPQPEVRWTAAELLGQLGPVAHAASDDLLLASGDSDSHVRALSAIAIPKVETPASQAIPVLIPLLGSEHAGVVARAISAYKGGGQEALPALIKLLDDESRDTETRWNAARAIGKLGPEGLDALPTLVKYTTHAEETIREHSAEAIGDIGPLAIDGIPALINCLDDPATRVRRDAVRSLGYLGPAAKSAVPQIKLMLQDPESMVREAALNALKAIAPVEIPSPSSQEQKPSEPPAPAGPDSTEASSKT